MSWFLIESLTALALGVFIVWWTMRGAARHGADADPGTSAGEAADRDHQSPGERAGETSERVDRGGPSP